MSLPRKWLFAWLVAASLAAGSAAAAATGPAHGIATAMFDPWPPAGDFEAEAARIRAAGASYVRLALRWPDIAPETRAQAFEPSDPNDPGYRWSQADARVTEVVTAGFTPIVDIVGAPRWAQTGPPSSHGAPYDPDPQALAQFVTALATRYGGTYEDLPRVKYWQIFNEPNINGNLVPQYRRGRPVSPTWYRKMVNAAARAAHAVRADNVVIVGGLTPFTFRNEYSLNSVPPLRFMRELLCMSAGAHPRPTCRAEVVFDVWAHHPYTSGGPTHRAARPDDVSLGDLNEMSALLRAAVRAGHVRSARAPQFWVTEFSWDSKPPDTEGVPVGLEARWVAEAVYRMWLNGVSLVTWFSVSDQAFPQSYYQSGLYFVDGRAKPARQAFRFPFVAFRSGSKIDVWGRTPFGAKAHVLVEQKAHRRWIRVASVNARGSGIFRARVPATRSGPLRARVQSTGERSLPFSLTVPPDLPVNPFGHIG